MAREKSRYHAWERFPGESEKDFKRRLNSISKRKQRMIEKEMRFRAWEQYPGESAKDFKKRLWAEKRTILFKPNENIKR